MPLLFVMPLFTLLGLLAAALAGLCLYAASPHQRLLAASWPQRPARLASAVLLAAGWLAFAQDMQRLAATFTFCTALMLVLVVWPYVGALLHVRRTR